MMVPSSVATTIVITNQVLGDNTGFDPESFLKPLLKYIRRVSRFYIYFSCIFVIPCIVYYCLCHPSLPCIVYYCLCVTPRYLV